MATIQVAREAELDLLHAVLWYEDQQSGLGEKLEHDVAGTMVRIGENPQAFQFRYKHVRVIYTEIFPFGIHYLQKADQVFVIGIFHTSMAPERWDDRLDQLR